MPTLLRNWQGFRYRHTAGQASGDADAIALKSLMTWRDARKRDMLQHETYVASLSPLRNIGRRVDSAAYFVSMSDGAGRAAEQAASCCDIICAQGNATTADASLCYLSTS